MSDDTATSTVASWWEAIPVTEVAQIALVILLAIIVQVFASRLIRGLVRRAIARAPEKRPVNRELDDADAEIEAGLRERTRQRAQALGTLLRSAVDILIWAIAIITILSIMGINVAPILASAGLAGVIIGFGAQTLVADYLAGISMTFEDQLGVGDVISTGQVTGVVEEVALRYTRIRDFNGTVWYIRNGQMQYIANQSQGWIYAVVDMDVPVDADLNRVREAANAAGQQLWEDTEFRDDLIEAPTLAGLEAVAGDAMTVRVMGRIHPGRQSAVIRRLRGYVKSSFDAAGITVPERAIEVDEMPKGPEAPRLGG